MNASDDVVVARHVAASDGPDIGRRGLSVLVVFQPATEPGSGPASVLSHASTAMGWSVGQDAAGAARVVVGTAAGPLALSAGEPIPSGTLVRVSAHLPGEVGDELVLRVEPLSPDAPPAAEARARLGAPILPSRGPVLRGCREFGTDRRPIQVFRGLIREVLVVADADARPADLATHPRLVLSLREPLVIPASEGLL